jgi:Ca2+-binding EF-hand superfamily protein
MNFRAMNPTKLAERVFKAGDTDKDGTISFREFALIMYIMTKAPKEDKLNAIFGILDLDGNGTLSSAEVIQAVKQAYDIMGQLNVDFSNKGIEVIIKKLGYAFFSPKYPKYFMPKLVVRRHFRVGLGVREENRE